MRILMITAVALSTLMTLQAFGASHHKFSPRQMESWPGCDGMTHQIPVPTNIKTCMENGPRLSCPEDATAAHCRARFNG